MFAEGSPTEILAQIVGLFLLATGIGAFTSRELYDHIIADLRGSALLTYLGGLIAFVLGAVIVTLHTIWTGAAAIVITIIGWVALIEGVALLAVPKLYLKLVTRLAAMRRLIRIMAAVSVVLGAWLLAVGLGIV